MKLAFWRGVKRKQSDWAGALIALDAVSVGKQRLLPIAKLALVKCLPNCRRMALIKDGFQCLVKVELGQCQSGSAQISAE